MIFRLTYIVHILIVFSVCSCRNTKNIDENPEQIKSSQAVLKEQQIDSLELFFQSKGILRFNPTDINLKKDFEILNEDNTVYATLNLSLDKIIIQGKQFSLNEFVNDNSSMSQYQFFPKEFFPDQSIILFEYESLTNDVAEIFINKEQSKKKKIKLSADIFKIESWKEHLIGCMIDFNVKINPIRAEVLDNSKSLGFENSGEDYIYVIREIVGDWVKIECAEICDYPCSSEKKYDGWIKWKAGNKLLIRLLYSC